MFTKEQVQKAIKEIDDNLALLSGPRQAHLVLVNDVKIIQEVCMRYFEETKDVRTNEPIDVTPISNENS